MRYFPSTSRMLFTPKLLSTLCVGIALTSSFVQAATWDGSESSDLTTLANYGPGDTVPTFGGTNSGGLFISNGPTGFAFTYTEDQGATTFTGGNLRIAPTGSTNGSTLNITGGDLTIQSSENSTIGFGGAGGTLNMTGGTLTVNGTDAFLFGNEQAATANISGGVVTIGNQFLFARDGGATVINLSGSGVFDVTNALGTQYGSAPNGGNTLGTINLSGNSIFKQTASNAINLTGNFFINFTYGDAAQFSLLGSDTASLNSLIVGGHFKIDGVVNTDPSVYKITGAASASDLGTISAVPEPSTWALILGGMFMLLFVQRLNRKRVA